MTPTHAATAWQAIGWDEGIFRIKGGRELYEAVMYNCETGGRLVKIARLQRRNPLTGDIIPGIREQKRYVDPDTVLEFFNPEPSMAEYHQFQLIP